MLSWETHGDGDEHIRLWRAFAVYEKQLFTEKMVTVCFMDHNKVKEWDESIKAPVLNRQEFVDIWEDKSGVDVSIRVDASTWFHTEKRQSIRSGAQGDSIAEHASAIWQDFDIALIMPEPYDDQRQYWFIIDTYMLRPNPDTHPERCFSAMDVVECRTPTSRLPSWWKRLFADMHRVRTHCRASYLDNFQQLTDSQKYALASAMYAYDATLQGLCSGCLH